MAYLRAKQREEMLIQIKCSASNSRTNKSAWRGRWVRFALNRESEIADESKTILHSHRNRFDFFERAIVGRCE
jgi:hypothetical protein